MRESTTRALRECTQWRNREEQEREREQNGGKRTRIGTHTHTHTHTHTRTLAAPVSPSFSASLAASSASVTGCDASLGATDLLGCGKDSRIRATPTHQDPMLGRERQRRGEERVSS